MPGAPKPGLAPGSGRNIFVVAGLRPALAGLRPATTFIMSLQGLKVLIVEDELLILELFEFTLKLHRADVRTARSVNEAMNLLESWLPDVIVTDIGLPEKDGYTFIKSLRTQQETRTLPVIALSGYVSVSDGQLDGDQFLIKIGKPVDPDYLVRILAEKAKRIRPSGDQDPPEE